MPSSHLGVSQCSEPTGISDFSVLSTERHLHFLAALTRYIQGLPTLDNLVKFEMRKKVISAPHLVVAMVIFLE
jgi:hypothetical protein